MPRRETGSEPKADGRKGVESLKNGRIRLSFRAIKNWRLRSFKTPTSLTAYRISNALPAKPAVDGCCIPVCSRNSHVREDVERILPQNRMKSALLCALIVFGLLAGFAVPVLAAADAAQPTGGGGEMNVKLPDLNDARFLGDSIGGKDLLYTGLVVSVLGIAFGVVVCLQVRSLPVHQSMLRRIGADLSDLQDLSHRPGQVLVFAVAVCGRGDRLLLQVFAELRDGRGCASFCCSASSESWAAMEWPGLAFA